MNVKDIAATLAILGSGALVLAGCGKDAAPPTEVPAGGDAAPTDTGDSATDDLGLGDEGGEASCGGEDHTEEGHCGAADEGGDAEEGGEGGEEGEASCGGAQ